MRTEASNVLLKILEEPWERTLFLLVAHHTEQMLPTILSRVQQTTLPYLSPRRTDSEADEQFEAFSSLMRMCYSNKHLDMFEWVEAMASAGRETIKRFLEYAVSMLRESYLQTAGIGEISYLSGTEAGFVSKFAPFITSENIETLVQECETALRDISQNGNPRIVLTHFVLTISKMIGKN
jgi:DNA polymerase-3 subunit delta'